jgi:hypothetical protein
MDEAGGSGDPAGPQKSLQATDPRSLTEATSGAGSGLQGTETKDTYAWEPLEPSDEKATWIRLLILEPGTGDDPISCQLRPFNLATVVDLPSSWTQEPNGSSTRQVPVFLEEDSPGGDEDRFLDVASDTIVRYEALSYACGHPNIKTPIQVHGKAVQVTTNLESALRHLRSPFHPRVLWVDAICISQQDIQERNAQILHMASIYRLAALVIAWLGEGDDSSDNAFELLSFIAKAVKNRPQLDSQTFQLLKDTIQLAGSQYKFMSTVWKTFMERSWFHRLWVAQEVRLAQRFKFVCGCHCLTGEQFDNFAGEPGEEFGLSRLFPITFMQIRPSSEGIESKIFPTLISYGEKVCLDPRDKIYALLSILRLKIIPDYSLSVGQVYEQAARAIIREDHNLTGVFYGPRCCDSTFAKAEHPNLVPSWVPDFSRFSILKLDRLHKFQNYRMGFANQLNKDAPKFLLDPEMCVLDLRGTIFGHVSEISPRLDLTSMHWQDDVRKWEPSGLTKSHYPTGESSMDCYWRTLIFDRADSERLFQKTCAELQEYKDSFQAWRLMTYKDDTHDSVDMESKRLARERFMESGLVSRDTLHLTEYCFKFDNKFALELSHTIKERKFGRLENGFFSMVPENTVQGDVVAVVHGAKLPIVIRRLSDQETAKLQGYEGKVVWRLIGTTYVHGIMDGEVFGLIEKGVFLEEVIHLA